MLEILTQIINVALLGAGAVFFVYAFRALAIYIRKNKKETDKKP